MLGGLSKGLDEVSVGYKNAGSQYGVGGPERAAQTMSERDAYGGSANSECPREFPGSKARPGECRDIEGRKTRANMKRRSAANREKGFFNMGGASTTSVENLAGAESGAGGRSVQMPRSGSK
jgi:hypothetical protein